MRHRVDDDVGPARAVGDHSSHRFDPAIGDVDDHRALLAAFAHAPPLQVAGIDDPGLPGDDLEGVNVTERPVLVALRSELGRCAGRVILMARPAAGGMQHADVEPARDRLGIGARVVLDDLAMGKSTTVQSDAQVVDPVRFGATGGEFNGAGRPNQ